MSVKVIPVVNVYASGIALKAGEVNEISDDDFRYLSAVKKVKAVKDAKAEAADKKPVKKKVVKKKAATKD